MGISVASLGLRAATTQMNVHFLEAVDSGRLVCQGEILHRTRRSATAQARVYDGAGRLIAVGTGAFRLFERISGT